MGFGRPVEFSRRPGGGPIDLDTLKRKSWSGVTAQFIRIAPPASYDFRLTKSSNYIALHDLYRTDGETRLPGQPRNHLRDLRNKLTFLPTGCDIEGWSVISKSASIIAAYLDQDAQERERIDLSKLRPLLQFEDQMLRSTLLRFQAILHDPSLDLSGYAETLGSLVAFEIGRLNSQIKQPHVHQGGLTARQIRLIVDHIDGHLTEQMTIAELAGLIDLSRYHFIRAFRHSVGFPPHQFIVRRRIERAKELLGQRDTSIADTAARCGFNSATQLTRAFRRLVGTTPSVFRRESA